MQSEGSCLNDFLQEAITIEGSGVKLELSDDDFDELDDDFTKDFLPDAEVDDDDEEKENCLKKEIKVNGFTMCFFYPSFRI